MQQVKMLTELSEILQWLKATPEAALDLETELNGAGSIEYWHPDFKLSGISVYANGTGVSVLGHTDSLLLLKTLNCYSTSFIVHNYQFERAVLNRFGFDNMRISYDTMRLVQMADNGAGPDEDEHSSGLGLVDCAMRWVTWWYIDDHKKRFHDWLSKNGFKKHDYNRLPADLLKEYNLADTVVTWDLYTVLKGVLTFPSEAVDYDHKMYKDMCDRVLPSRTAGVLVDCAFLEDSVSSFQTDLDRLLSEFREKFKPQIEEIEREKREAFIGALTTERGRAARERTITPDKYEFNLNSSSDKIKLFVDKLGIQPSHFTPNGSPSFEKKILGQWGEGGFMLINKGSLNLGLTQAKTILEKSKHDGRWHIDLFVAGTTTGRMKGGGGVNVQALSRREPRLMKGLKADPGHSFVSVDLSSGEPSIIAHFSQDRTYTNAVFGMVGKEPYYEGRTLMIDDIYILAASISPLATDLVYNLFHTWKSDTGLSFAEQWQKDPDVLKKGPLKKTRELHKTLVLGVGYEMGASKMVINALKSGFQITQADARKFIKSWWGTMTGVAKLRKQLKDLYESEGELFNIFGYRLVPNKSYKAMNYFIQSTVNGLINFLSTQFFNATTPWKLVTVIHDEIIFQVPDDQISEAKRAWESAVDALNNELNWSIKIRTGWVVGKDMYDAK